MIKITVLGAGSGVTGSKHLIDTGHERVLLDCGTWQGREADTKNRSLPIAPSSLDAIILSHAHLDHCGLLPRYIKHGYTGKIYSTPATEQVAAVMLADAAKIQEQDEQYQKAHNLPTAPPLFTAQDVADTLTHFQPVPYARHHNTWTSVTPNIDFKFYDAGHIIGSAVTVLRIKQADTTRYIAYSGDLGPLNLPLLRDPEIPPEPIDTLLLESTYGSRTHQPLAEALDRLATAIKTICARHGKIIVPAFSLGRTQTIVYLLHKLTDEGKIPRLPIFVDSPLATDITDITHQDTVNYDTETWQDFVRPHTPLNFHNLTYTHSADESKALNITPGPFIVIAGSGMMTAGRVIHHLRHSIADPKNALFITGYQAEGTLGRKILDGASQVKLYGDVFPVRSEVFLFNEFSAHADREQLQAYAEKMTHLKRLILVHGEPHQADDLKTTLTTSHPEWSITRPEEGGSIEI